MGVRMSAESAGMLSLRFQMPTLRLKQQLLERFRIVRKLFGHKNHAVDYTDSGDETRGQHLVRTIAPQVETVQ